jgi:IclR family KDG regulon transcriptional repressor
VNSVNNGEKQSVQHVQSVERAMLLLEILADASKEGMSLAKLSAAAGLHKTTAYRLLATLMTRGYVEQYENGNYGAGIGLVSIACKRLDQIEIKYEAEPYLYKLYNKFGYTVHLGVPDEFEMVYINKIEAPQAYRLHSQIGLRVSIFYTAMGKSILMYTPEVKLDRMLKSKEYKSYIKSAGITEAEYRSQLAEYRSQGWALDDEENEPGIRCIAAPIFDYHGSAVAAISITGLAQWMTQEQYPEIALQVRDAAFGISQRLGYSAKD